MSLTFRNLILFALLCVLISSLSISSQAHRNQNQHMIKIQESATMFPTHQQTATDTAKWAQTAQNILDSISSSVDPKGLKIIDTKNLPTFAFDKSSCDNLKDDQRKQLQDKIKTTRDSVTSLKPKVTDKKVSADVDNSIQYLNTIQKLTKVKCAEVTKYLLIGPTPYQTNINTKQPWILGGMTMDDLVKDYINRITVNNNATSCGTDTPFWNGFKCIACNDPKPIFNIATSECVACPQGKEFDAITRTCIDSKAPVPKSWKPNAAADPKIIVPADAPKDALSNYMNTGKDLCPADKPFVKDNACISCPTDKPYFNIIAKECQQCPNGTVFNATTHQCPAAAKSFKPNAAAEPKVLLPADAPKDALPNYMNTGKDLCPADKPFVKDNACISCPTDKPYFNIIAKECQQCPNGTVFNATTHQCPAAAKSFKPNAAAEPKVLLPADAPKDALSNYMNTGKDPCPADKPFVKDNTCIPCPADKPYFNIIAKECQQCQAKQVFDVATHKCVPAKPNATDVQLHTSRLVMNDNSTSADWDKYVKENENKVFCPEDKPFWTGTECIQCPDLFNVITRKCITCEPGLSIHTDTHKCEPANRLEPSLKDLFNAIF